MVIGEYGGGKVTGPGMVATAMGGEIHAGGLCAARVDLRVPHEQGPSGGMADTFECGQQRRAIGLGRQTVVETMDVAEVRAPFVVRQQLSLIHI